MSLQEALKLLRMELGMTQDDLAKKLNKAYVTVNRWENGKGFPSRSNARTILDIARKGHVSSDCIAYLNKVLLPDTKRAIPATAYGFPDIDRDFLFQLADGSTNALYVIDKESYRLLYANQKAESMAAKYLSETGVSVEGRMLVEQTDRHCYHYFGNRDEPCPFCPLKEIDSADFKDITITVPDINRKLLVHAKASEMKDRAVYIMYLTDVTQEDAERNALYDLTNDIPSGVGIYHVYMDDRIELAFMNRIMLDMVGEARADSLMRNGPSKMCLVHPKDRQLLMAEIRDSIAGKRNVSLDIRMKVNGGQYEKLHLDAKLIKKGEQRFTFYCLFNRID